MTEQKIPEAGKQRSVLEEEKNPNHKIIEVFKLSEMLSSHKNGVEEAKPQTQAWLEVLLIYLHGI